MNYPSRLVENAVAQIAKLPGIGNKTALRLVMHLLKQEENYTIQLAEALVQLRTQTSYCQQCHHISENALCSICADSTRDGSLLCIVEQPLDVLAIESTGQYKGLYHVLGGIISPIEGIGPDHLHIETLLHRVAQGEIKEVIFAISATMEGDTTAFYLSKKLKNFPVKITTLARGIPIGGQLEYADEITLGRSIMARTLYQSF
ncbi:MAG: recombination mediator RecR [Cytophagales bacterium]|nr:recombination mediator RecR [Bernardetiaceae bacterium]MDW8211359.1 recombination mediator RecR [Cytophagales bacterium]